MNTTLDCLKQRSHEANKQTAEALPQGEFIAKIDLDGKEIKVFESKDELFFNVPTSENERKRVMKYLKDEGFL